MGSSTGGRVADSSSAGDGDTAAGGDKSLLKKLCPPWPLSNLIRYLRRLSDAFGARYVFSVILTYGVNQSIGERWIYYARSYYLLDEVGLSSQYYGQLLGFSSIPCVEIYRSLEISYTPTRSFIPQFLKVCRA